MIEVPFTCGIAHGLHARPASALAEIARRFTADIRLARGGAAADADARSPLEVVALDIEFGQACTFRVSGEDEAAAAEAVRSYALRVLAVGERAEPAAGSAACAGPPARLGAASEGALPAPSSVWRRLKLSHIAGVGVSPGLGTGPIVWLGPADDLDAAIAGMAGEAVSAGRERERLEVALAEVVADLNSAREGGASDAARAIAAAHLAFAGDPALRRAIEMGIDQGQHAARAARAAVDRFAGALGAAQSELMRERELDVRDVGGRLVRALLGLPAARALDLSTPAVLVGPDLAPGLILALAEGSLRGVITSGVGPTSHTVILLRSLGVPTMIVDPALLRRAPGEPRGTLGAARTAMLDGAIGIAYVDPHEEALGLHAIRVRAENRRARRRAASMLISENMPAPTDADNPAIELAGNAGSAADIVRAVVAGAAAVGLFRTEMLFLDRDQPPSEEEQLALYIDALGAADGRAVIFRTLDIGGDKPARFLKIPREANPFLGVRGLRLARLHEGVLHTQLRALCRASAHGSVKVMAPMVTTPEEMAWFRGRVQEAQRTLAAGRVPYDRSMPVGAMLEVPAACEIIDLLAAHADFFSLGTNDLSQYAAAAERGLVALAALVDPLQPAFIRLLIRTVRQAQASKRWIGVCGEAGGDERLLPLWAALNVDELSMIPPRLAPTRAALGRLDRTRGPELLSELERAADAAVSAKVLRSALEANLGAEPLTHAGLVELDSPARTKAAAIRSLVALAYADGRAHDFIAVEDAVWAREETHATALGFGFATPHCRCDSNACPTVALIRLAQPIDWEAADGEPVTCAILLMIPAAGDARQHMAVLAKLARALMHDEFRARLLNAPSAEAVAAALLEVARPTTIPPPPIITTPVAGASASAATQGGPA